MLWWSNNPQSTYTSESTCLRANASFTSQTWSAWRRCAADRLRAFQHSMDAKFQQKKSCKAINLLLTSKAKRWSTEKNKILPKTKDFYIYFLFFPLPHQLLHSLYKHPSNINLFIGLHSNLKSKYRLSPFLSGDKF